VVDWDDVRRCALALPEVSESDDARQWQVGAKLFLWERPLRKGDLAALGETAPSGPILEVVAVEAYLARAPKRLCRQVQGR
jgi:hypothetical protein